MPLRLLEGTYYAPLRLLLSGAIYAHSSEVYINGDTVFADNSAEDNGGEILE